MKLQIRYIENGHPTVNAAFLRGHDPLSWLKEIDRWNIPTSEIECYLVPQSIQSVDAAGLFVFFKNPLHAKHLDLADPYTSIENRLFIPCHATFLPQVSRSEWNNILLWDKQVFHPLIGLVGFEPKDEIKPENLFLYDEPIHKDWTFANPGLPAKPSLNEISIIAPTAENLMKTFQEEIGKKPLRDLRKDQDGNRSAMEKFTDAVKFGLLKGLHTIINATGKMAPANSGGDSGGGSTGKQGWFQQLQHWIARNLDELQKRRDDEIQRLLRLFDENVNDALQYAIPLDSPYMNRGSQSASSTLTRRPLQLDLGRLGGGMIVDSWDVGNYYFDLRTKYLNAAQKEIERKDFKKAAYIYAHLLGDYNSAANTLRQGGMYREAAAIYKDHLKNKSAAADCLEAGGLFLEAIELNKELNKDEKIGDLYQLINQPKNAAIYYENYVHSRLQHADHLDAARVLDEKMKQRERARQVLMEGWSHSYQAENCLQRYFDIVMQEEPGATGEMMKKIYAKSTPRHKRLPLLNVMEYVSKKNKDEDTREVTESIMYEILHEETKAGNLQALNSLKKFLPGDRLAGSDASRYINSNRNTSVRSSLPGSITLDQSIHWIKAVWHGSQFLVLGIKNSLLHLARANWYGNIEYYSWTNPVKSHTRFTFVNAPHYGNYIIIHSSDGLPVTRKNLPKNKYFNQSLTVYCPVWLHKATAQFIMNDEKTISKIEVLNNNMTLHHYTLEGELRKSVNCVFDREPPVLSQFISNPLMAAHGGKFYTYVAKQFLIVTETGKAEAIHFDTLIRFFAPSISIESFYIVISTNKGCLLYDPSSEKKFETAFFAEDLIPTCISFVHRDRFVIMEKNKAWLFEIEDQKPVRRQEYILPSYIIAALPTSNYPQFALVESSGKITICEVDKSPI